MVVAAAVHRRGPTASQRGVGYWPGDGTLAPRILFMSGNRLIAVDAATGAPADGFGDDGRGRRSVSRTAARRRSIATSPSSAPRRGRLPQGPPGNPRAFDVITGKKLWEFWTVPRPGEKYNDTWGDGWKNRSGANMWGFAAPVDVERGIVYLPIAGPATNYYGGDRPGNNAFANSIVAVDAQTRQVPLALPDRAP